MATLQAGCNLCGLSFEAHGLDELAPCPLNIDIYGRWDELEEICTPMLLKQQLEDVHGDDVGTAAKMFESLQGMYTPLGLSGTFTVQGIDTAANSYPGQFEVALDKQGQPLTLSIGPHAAAIDIMRAVVAISDLAFDGFPHHYWFEGLLVHPTKFFVNFSMGS